MRKGQKHTEETIQKMREAKSGKNHPLWGKHPSAETKKKQREARIGKYAGENNPMWGKYHTEKAKQKIREGNKGKKDSAETKKKKSEGQKGRKHTAEENKKNSERQKGENGPNWKNGCDIYWHIEAWKSFGKKECFLCGMTNEEHIKKTKCRLTMHCTGDPKDYTLQEKSNWETYCISCHQTIENQLRKLKKEAKARIKIKLNRRCTLSETNF